MHRHVLVSSLTLTLAAQSIDSDFQAILHAEYTRAATTQQWQQLIKSARHGGARPLALRAIGRLASADGLPVLESAIQDPDPKVRTAAALGLPRVLESLTELPRAAACERIEATLIATLGTETNPQVWECLALALGRLPMNQKAVLSGRDAALAVGLQHPNPQIRLGALRGLYARRQLHPKILIAEDHVALLEARMRSPEDPPALRRLAVQILVPLTKSPQVWEGSFRDGDPQVRRLALRGLASLTTGSNREGWLAIGLKDTSFLVRLEALSLHLPTEGWEGALAATHDESAHVANRAIRNLGAYKGQPQVVARLLELAHALPQGEAARGWHLPARAILSLAQCAPQEAALALGPFLTHPRWQVRVYAAFTAGDLADRKALTQLLADPSPNVQEAALDGLVTLDGRGADAACLKILSKASNASLLLRAGQSLKGATAQSGTSRSISEALQRLSRIRCDSNRDTRLCLIQRLQEMGDKSLIPSLKPLLKDPDPEVAKAIAGLFQSWDGLVYPDFTRHLDLGPSPTAHAIESLPKHLEVVMETGARFTLRMRTDVAPFSCIRFMKRAREGYYKGLSFHRVLPGFILQGGSPGASENVGDTRFMRDEFSELSQVRGTLGISTRGPDTGDAQIYINLVDNPELDREYTVFAEVVQGMEAVDGILEGDRMVGFRAW